MLGATPPTLGNLQGIFYDWLHERTLWRHQAALRRAAGDRRADYAAAKAALLKPLSVSMCKRPSPDMLFRTCKGAADGGPEIGRAACRERVSVGVGLGGVRFLKKKKI